MSMQRIVRLAAGVAMIAVAATSARAAEVEVLHWWTSGGEADGARRAEEESRDAGRDLEGHAGRRRRRRAGDDGAARPRHGRQSADRRADARLRHHRLGEAGRASAIWTRSPTRKAGTRSFRPPCRISPSMTASGSPRRSTSTRPTGCGPTRRPSTLPAARRPRRWDELIAVLDKMKANGITPLAHGGQPWQDATIFDARRAVDRRPTSTRSVDDRSRPGGARLRQDEGGLRPHGEARAPMSTTTSPAATGTSPPAMVIEGKAGIQIMGDWAKGEFLKAGKKPGNDFVCIRFPGTQGAVTFNSDQFMMFKVGDDKKDCAAQDGLRHRGSGLPVGLQRRQGLGAGAHRRSERRLRRLRQEGHEGPGRSQRERHAASARWRMAMPRRRRSRTRIYDVVTRHFNGELDSEAADEGAGRRPSQLRSSKPHDLSASPGGMRPPQAPRRRFERGDR